MLIEGNRHCTFLGFLGHRPAQASHPSIRLYSIISRWVPRSRESGFLFVLVFLESFSASANFHSTLITLFVSRDETQRVPLEDQPRFDRRTPFSAFYGTVKEGSSFGQVLEGTSQPPNPEYPGRYDINQHQ